MRSVRVGGKKEGQGLCPWTKLGTSPQTPLILSEDREGGNSALPTHSLPPSLSSDLISRF